MSELERLLEVQELDSALDQLPHRSERLPERAAHRDLTGELTAAQARADAATGRIDAAEQRIGKLEEAGAARTAKKAKLNQQLKTVIASREAEALMAEIATLDRDRSEADDEELELLDVVEAAEADRAEAQADIDRLTIAVAEAAAALADAQAELDRERGELTDRRTATAAQIADAMVTKYERLRKGFGGVAISRLHAGRCGACHLDQSRAGLEAVKTAADDAEIECEQCGRLLVR